MTLTELINQEWFNPKLLVCEDEDGNSISANDMLYDGKKLKDLNIDNIQINDILNNLSIKLCKTLKRFSLDNSKADYVLTAKLLYKNKVISESSLDI